MSEGMLEALSEAIGESDNEIGGLVETRLTSVVNPRTPLAAVFTWNGTTTVATPNTSEVTEGDWISLDSDGQLFQIIAVLINTNVEIDNPAGYVIPTGATASSKTTRSLPVESALDWEEEGRVGVDGVLYRYASRTDKSLDEITHVRGGVLTAGVKRAHRVAATAINMSREKSAVDLVRRAMLVEYAESDDLNALGRNLGVNRLPFIASDDVFREIVKALGYNPKGTMFGLELALDALVGAGNYEIVEDLINYPCTVFIRLLGSSSVDTISVGKAYFSGEEFQPATGDTTLSINVPVVSRGVVGSVRWKDENVVTDSRIAYPSAHVLVEYIGDPGNPAWVVQGTGVAEGAQITLAGGATEFTLPAPTNNSFYQRKLRLQPESRAVVAALLTVPTGAALDGSIVTGMLLDDGQQTCNVGVFANAPTTFQVGIVSGGAFVNGGFTLQRDSYYEVALKKSGTGNWELFIDGRLVESVPYAGSLPSFGGFYFVIGHFAVAGTSNQLRVRQLGVWVSTTTDYWTGRGTAGSVSVTPPNEKQLNVGSSFFIPGDVGKLVETKNSGVVNAQGGNNNGRFIIDSLVSGSVVELRGPVEANATVQAAFPTRIEVPIGGELFQFPDDLGKEIVISGSVLGNNGTYVISDLLQAGTLTSLKTGFATSIPEKTNICEVVAASFVTEAGLDWQRNPSFATEAGLDWEMSSAGSVVGTALTLRQALPISSSGAHRVLSVVYSQVLSAQLLANSTFSNQVIQEFPDLLFSYYPFYIADPLGFVRTYLDGITAAGVIPDFLVE